MRSCSKSHVNTRCVSTDMAHDSIVTLSTFQTLPEHDLLLCLTIRSAFEDPWRLACFSTESSAGAQPPYHGVHFWCFLDFSGDAQEDGKGLMSAGVPVLIIRKYVLSTETMVVSPPARELAQPASDELIQSIWYIDPDVHMRFDSGAWQMALWSQGNCSSCHTTIKQTVVSQPLSMSGRLLW